MADISIEKLSKEELDSKGVFSWPTWEKEPSEFDWSYSSPESCYILEGKAQVVPKNGKPVEFGAGDFVVFPQGMDCVWKISEGIKKHYNFS